MGVHWSNQIDSRYTYEYNLMKMRRKRSERNCDSLHRDAPEFYLF